MMLKRIDLRVALRYSCHNSPSQSRQPRPCLRFRLCRRACLTMSAGPSHEANYHDNYSEDEEDSSAAAQAQNEEQEEDPDEEEDEEEDDFLPTRRVPSESEPPKKMARIDPSLSVPPLNAHSRPSVPVYGPLEPSIINVEPLDEFMREVSEWILRVANGRDNIEVGKTFPFSFLIVYYPIHFD